MIPDFSCPGRCRFLRIGPPAVKPPSTGPRNPTGTISPVENQRFFARQLSKPWDAFIEYAGDFAERGGSRQLLHVGSAYKLTRRQQVDFQVAAGLSHAAPHMFVGVGYSFFLHVGSETEKTCLRLDTIVP
jgi:hypothetical protein